MERPTERTEKNRWGKKVRDSLLPVALVTDQSDYFLIVTLNIERVCSLIWNTDSQIRGRPSQEGLLRLSKEVLSNIHKPQTPSQLRSVHVMTEIPDGSILYI